MDLFERLTPEDPNFFFSEGRAVHFNFKANFCAASKLLEELVS
jgi:hypothetical protein